MPVPDREIASVPMAMFPNNSKAAPEVTVTPPAVVPRAVALAARSTPAVI